MCQAYIGSRVKSTGSFRKDGGVRENVPAQRARYRRWSISLTAPRAVCTRAASGADINVAEQRRTELTHRGPSTRREKGHPQARMARRPATSEREFGSFSLVTRIPLKSFMTDLPAGSCGNANRGGGHALGTLPPTGPLGCIAEEIVLDAPSACALSGNAHSGLLSAREAAG